MIGGVGRLVPQKNFTVLLDVAARVVAKQPGVIFIIAGTGPQDAELKARADALGLGNHVRFLGHVTDRISLYHALDLLLMTSDFEGTPMTLLEAMASGLPVVASAVDGVGEVCKNERDALLVTQRDVQGFITAVQRIITEGEFARRLGANARATILGGYEIRGLVRSVETLYEEVLEDQ